MCPGISENYQIAVQQGILQIYSYVEYDIS
jgi:hypothetical protein